MGQGYRGYGNYRTGGALPTEHRFTGQKLDIATGLMYYNARYYDRAIGHFISPDTLVPDPTSVWDYNRLAYARLNPLKYNDPTGHWVETLWDVANIAWGAASLAHNVSEGNWGDAAWDAGGLLVDSAATIVPLIPGGAAATLKASRALDKAVKTVQRAGNAFEAVRVGGELVQTSTLLARHFERAAEFGIRSADELKQAVGNGSGLHVHHIVEQRFARIIGVADESSMLSVVLKPEEHAWFTAKWREEIGLSSWTSRRLRTDNASRDDIWRAAQKIYQDYPELLEAARRTIFGE